MNEPEERGATAPLSPQQAAAMSFEEALNRLEQTVEHLEAGDMSLEDTLRLFEEGMLLRRTCLDRLQAAEARIETVLAEQSPEPEGAAQDAEA